MRPFADGVYVNFMSDEPAPHVKVAYGDRTYARLAALKSKVRPLKRLPLQPEHRTGRLNAYPAGALVTVSSMWMRSRGNAWVGCRSTSSGLSGQTYEGARRSPAVRC
jgi:hypothetical protein